MESLNNTKAEEEYIELFNRISKRIDILKKSIGIVSNPVEKKRIKNLIKTVDTVLNYFLNMQESTESDFSSDIEGKGLEILTPNQMLSRLSISLAQLKAGNNSEKLKKRN